MTFSPVNVVMGNQLKWDKCTQVKEENFFPPCIVWDNKMVGLCGELERLEEKRWLPDWSGYWNEHCAVLDNTVCEHCPVCLNSAQEHQCNTNPYN